MTNLWITGFKGALLTYVRSYYPTAQSITSWDEDIDTYAGQTGCDTCGWGADDPYTLSIHFLNEDGSTGTYSTATPFGELLNDLIRLEGN